MITNVLPLLNKLIPVDLAKKALSRVDPRLGKFLTNAVGAGYSINAALDFMRSQYGSTEEEGLRPDEQAANKRVQQTNRVPNAIATAGKVALGGVAAPMVLGNLFQGNEQQKVPVQPEKDERQKALSGFKNTVNKRKESELAQKQLIDQFDQAYGQQPQGQGKQQLLQSMKEITDYLQQLKGRNG